MKLTRASSYAIHAVAYMAAQKSDKPIASHLIAKERGIPERFLLKVLKPLVTARILASVKGPNGGYRLAKAASSVSMLDIIETVDGPIRGVSPGGHGNGSINGKLDHICKQTAEALRKHLEKVHVSDLNAKKG